MFSLLDRVSLVVLVKGLRSDAGVVPVGIALYSLGYNHLDVC